VRKAVVDASSRGDSIVVRGGGYSYGDAAINDGQALLDDRQLTGIVDWKPEHHTVLVPSGTTIAQLANFALVRGHWPPVVPGTSGATIGGCIGANVHGKNNPSAGLFGDHIDELQVVLGDGEQIVCSREVEAALFSAIPGSYGLLGIVTGARLRLRPVPTELLVEELAVPSVEAMLETLELREGGIDASVGWIDGFTEGDNLGRGLLHIAQEILPSMSGSPRTPSPEGYYRLDNPLARRSPASPWLWMLARPLLRPQAVRHFNAAVYEWGSLWSGRVRSVPVPSFHFVHDRLPGWNNAFRPGGLIQFQTFVPRAEALAVFSTVLKRMQSIGEFPLLGVMKRHRQDRFLLSYGVDGYSLSLDFRATRANSRTLTATLLDLARTVVLPAGGRFYPAKDAILTREDMLQSFGPEQVAEFFDLKRRYDPRAVFGSDLYRRLLEPPCPARGA